MTSLTTIVWKWTVVGQGWEHRKQGGEDHTNLGEVTVAHGAMAAVRGENWSGLEHMVKGELQRGTSEAGGELTLIGVLLEAKGGRDFPQEAGMDHTPHR